MAIDILHQPGSNHIEISVSKDFSFHDYHSTMNMILAKDTIPNSINALWDLRSLDVNSTLLDLFDRLAQKQNHYIKVRSENPRIAILLDNKNVENVKQIRDNIQNYLSKNTKLFIDYNQALSWVKSTEYN